MLANDTISINFQDREKGINVGRWPARLNVSLSAHRRIGALQRSCDLPDALVMGNVQAKCHRGIEVPIADSIEIMATGVAGNTWNRCAATHRVELLGGNSVFPSSDFQLLGIISKETATWAELQIPRNFALEMARMLAAAVDAAKSASSQACPRTSRDEPQSCERCRIFEDTHASSKRVGNADGPIFCIFALWSRKILIHGAHEQ
jgi:hypothetical protein